MKKHKGYRVRWDDTIYRSRAQAITHFKKLFAIRYGQGRWQGVEVFGNVLPVWVWIDGNERRWEERPE